MKPIIIYPSVNNEVILTKEEFEAHMTTAYEQGFRDGNSNYHPLSTQLGHVIYPQSDPYYTLRSAQITCAGGGSTIESIIT